jgi:hypothetical protein
MWRQVMMMMLVMIVMMMALMVDFLWRERRHGVAHQRNGENGVSAWRISVWRRNGMAK